MAIQRSATAHWEGDLKSGQGRISTPASGLLADTPYGFKTRFGDAKGTNPEELIAAAHAACLSMALAAGLEAGGTPATRIATTAKCTVEKAGEGFRITRMRLEVRGEVPGIDKARFTQAAQAARDGCPVSQALKGNVQMEVDARLA